MSSDYNALKGAAARLAAALGSCRPVSRNAGTLEEAAGLQPRIGHLAEAECRELELHDRERELRVLMAIRM